eukprot:3933470-Rhodomonas_salina.5
MVGNGVVEDAEVVGATVVVECDEVVGAASHVDCTVIVRPGSVVVVGEPNSAMMLAFLNRHWHINGR